MIKNDLKKNFDTDWVGFCHYRRFWLKDAKEKEYKDFKQSIVQEAPKEWNNHEASFLHQISFTQQHVHVNSLYKFIQRIKILS